MIDTSPKIAEGSIREYQDEIYHFIQMYKHGVWNTMVRIPLNEPTIIVRLSAFMNGIMAQGTPAPWPFPMPEKPGEEKPEPVQPSADQSTVDYERAKRVVEEQR